MGGGEGWFGSERVTSEGQAWSPPVSRLNGRQLRSVIAAVCREQRAPSTSCSKFHALRPPLLCLAPSSVLPPHPPLAGAMYPESQTAGPKKRASGHPPACGPHHRRFSLSNVFVAVPPNCWFRLLLLFPRGSFTPAASAGARTRLACFIPVASVCAENKRQVALCNAFVVTYYSALKVIGPIHTRNLVYCTFVS